MKRFLQVACGLALAAAPLAAGPVYLPVALNEIDGAYQRTTEVWVTNPDGAIQGFVVRRISSGGDGTLRTTGDEIGPYYLAPGESRRFDDLVPGGFRGMLELDGATVLHFSAALTSKTLQGLKVSESEIPVLTQADLSPSNEPVLLQGLERAGTTLTTNFGLVNLSHSPNACTVSLRQKDGLLIIQNVNLNLAPLTQAQFDDTFAILGLSVVPEGARAG
jgi:hypothetical protein